MQDAFKLGVLAVIGVLALIAANYAHDVAYQAHAIIVFLIASGMFVWTMRTAGEPAPAVETGYMDGVVKYGVVATAFWGVVGFLVGVYIAKRVVRQRLVKVAEQSSGTLV